MDVAQVFADKTVGTVENSGAAPRSCPGFSINSKIPHIALKFRHAHEQRSSIPVFFAPVLVFSSESNATRIWRNRCLGSCNILDLPMFSLCPKFQTSFPHAARSLLNSTQLNSTVTLISQPRQAVRQRIGRQISNAIPVRQAPPHATTREHRQCQAKGLATSCQER